MPRIARLDAPEVIHHVMIRGIEGRKKFRNNKDHKDLIEKLAKLCPEMEITCYAWAFMSNHAHFLFRTDQYPLSKLMRHLFNYLKARSLLCFWASRELGLSHTSLAKKLEMSLSNIVLSVERGELLATEGNYSLMKSAAFTGE
jgi:REP element-mobilizing transposase RayT